MSPSTYGSDWPGAMEGGEEGQADFSGGARPLGHEAARAAPAGSRRLVADFHLPADQTANR